MNAISNIMLQKLMDSGSGTLFYVLITLLLLVVSLIKGKKKAQTERFQNKEHATPQNSKQTSTASKEWGLDSLLSSMINENSPQASPEPEPELNEEDTEFMFDNAEEPEIEPAIKEGVSAFSKDNPATERVETGLFENIQTGQEPPDLGTDFSILKDETLREDYLSNILKDFTGEKAVIFSGILNPKYF